MSTHIPTGWADHAHEVGLVDGLGPARYELVQPLRIQHRAPFLSRSAAVVRGPLRSYNAAESPAYRWSERRSLVSARSMRLRSAAKRSQAAPS